MTQVMRIEIMGNFFKSSKKVITVLGIASMLALTAADACTGLKLVAEDGTVVNGRTLEFGVYVETKVAMVPRGYEFTGTTPDGAGMKYKAKYGAVGCMAFDDLSILDGMNEKGLAIGVFYFPGFAGYSKITGENRSKALSPIEFSNWVLTQFGTLEEVKSGLSGVVIAPTVYKDWGNDVPPFHYIVYDKAGKSLVIEPMDGKFVVYDNPIGVFTNSPTFDWHMTNLRNYINFKAENAAPLKMDGVELAPFGQGSGMVGLPGDFTPPSRFVRAAIFGATAIKPANSEDGVFQLFHILNQFDIPVGVARQKVNGVIHSDSTLATCVKNPQTLMYYFKTYENQGISSVDLKKLDLDAKEIKRVSTNGTQKVTDVTASLK